MKEAFISLLDFVPALTPRFSRTPHAAPLADAFERVARGEQVRAGFSFPPRHSKTVLAQHAVPWLHLQRPDLRIAYCMFGQRTADKKGRQIRELEVRAGVPIAPDSHSKRDWATSVDDGAVSITSVSGPIIGEGFDVIICDDLLKGRAAAESGAVRDNTYTWLTVDVESRLEPNGSLILLNTRWHPDDPIGRLAAAGDFQYVNLPALALENDALGRKRGEPLWPERWSLERLLKIAERYGGPESYEFLSMYQGVPKGRGASVFQDAHFYDTVDLAEARLCVGVDFAYSTKTSADFSVAVLLARVGDIYFVIDVVRVREEPRQFRSRVQLITATHPRARACTYAAATERGGVEFFRDGGIRIDGRTATVDKFSRSIATAAAWNNGKILLPRKAPWLDAFVSELCSFSGVKDRHDDQVDALAAAFDSLREMSTHDSYENPQIQTYDSPLSGW